MKQVIGKIKTAAEGEFGRDFIVRLIVSIALAFIGAMLVYLFLYLRPTDQLIPYVYSSFVQAVFTGPWYVIYQFPIFALLVLAINGFLAYRAFAKDKLISYLLLGFAALTNLLFLIDVINFVRLSH